MSSQIISAATKSASFNILYQIISRVVTFVLNAFILRYVTKDVLGIINVRLLLLYSTIQFISREPFRRMVTSEAKSRKWSTMSNIIWLSFPVSIMFSFVFATIWLKALTVPNRDEIPGYEFAVVAITCSVIVEMLAEPLNNYGQLNGYVKLRVTAEAIALFLRCSLMAICVRHNSRHSLYVFGLAQLASSISYVIFYWAYFSLKGFHGERIKSIKEMLPDLRAKPLLDGSLVMLSSSFLKQTIVKQLLTEGEKFVMTFFNPLSFSEQGIYDLVNNLGALAARFILQPVEESAYLVFSQFLDREKKPRDQSAESMATCRSVMTNVLKTMILVGLIIVCFGFNYSELALLMYAGRTFASGIGTVLLRWQCLYTLFIAVNGVTECFTFAAMNKQQLDDFNRILIALSVIYLTSAYFLTTLLGSQGFVLANCINMSCRIIYSLQFIKKYYHDRKETNPVKECIPDNKLIVIFIATFIALRISESSLCCHSLMDNFRHVAFGAILLLAVLSSVFFLERELIYFYIDRRKKKEE
ncbi:Protein RFT1 -like protein [Halotydeus destructor]|nr:Protein RFT1 -like protein [Halotydeus destructor]